jgi:hypothetical protein
MVRRFTLLCCTASLLGTYTRAADLAITSQLAEIVQSDGTPFPAGTAPPLDEPNGIPLIAKFDLFSEIDDLQPGEEGFGSVAFYVHMQSSQSNAALPIWSIPNPMIDSNGALPGGMQPKWEDVIVNRVDGSMIDRVQVVGVFHWPRTFGPPGVDPRRTTGQHGPEHLATVFLPWDGVSKSHVKLQSFQFSTYNEELLQNLSQSSPAQVDYLLGTSSRLFSLMEWDARYWSELAPAPTLSRTVSVDGVDVKTTIEGADRLFFSPMWNEQLPLIMHLDDVSQSVVQTIEFSTPVEAAKFSIHHVNAYGTAAGLNYVDQVEIVGLLGDDVVTPEFSLLKNEAQFEGSIITGVVGENPSDWNPAHVGVAFEQAIEGIRITFGNGLASLPGPPTHEIDDQMISIVRLFQICLLFMFNGAKRLRCFQW